MAHALNVMCTKRIGTGTTDLHYTDWIEGWPIDASLISEANASVILTLTYETNTKGIHLGTPHTKMFYRIL